MIETNSFFELKAKDLTQLQKALEGHNSVERTKESEGKLLVFLKQDIAAEELNTYLFKHNIVLEHLVKRKNSLEEQFLELTKN
jgi:ABC-2 type transport system ATP-binding protein